MITMLRWFFVRFAFVIVIFPLSKATSAEEHVVRIVSDYDNLRMTFDPKHLVIKLGDTVTWTNEANEEHNVISYPDGFPKGARPLRSQVMTTEGERWSYKFDIAGTYEYHCIPHLPMGMRGSIIVDRPSLNEEIHVPDLKEIREYRALLLKWFDEDDFEELENEDRADIAESFIANLLPNILNPI